MMFSSDRQRRAAFASMNGSKKDSGQLTSGVPEVYVDKKLIDESDKKNYKFLKFSIGDIRQRISMIDKLMKSKNITDFRRELLAGEKRDLEVELRRELDSDFAKRPQELGSIWVGGKYVHGPRIRLPKDFEFIKNVEPSGKYFHIEGSDKIPDYLPKGSKIIVGKLKDSGNWAVQSTLIPRESSLGKNLVAE